MNQGRSCGTCVFYAEDKPGLGLCREQPPVVLPMPVRPHTGGVPSKDLGHLAKPFTTWPVVRSHDWCGCWQGVQDDEA